MRALHRAGRKRDAVDAFERARLRLLEEFGVSPGHAIQDALREVTRASELAPAAVDDIIDTVAKTLAYERLVLVLGPCAGGERDDEQPLGSASDIARSLVQRFDCHLDYPTDLPRVAEYVAVTWGAGALHEALHALHDRDEIALPVHHALARVARALEAAGRPCPVILTSSFGDGLEQAMRASGVEYDLVAYLATNEWRGRFLHIAPGGAACLIELPNAYGDLVPGLRTVIIKILGYVDRLPERAWESFVVSEDDHIEYLAEGDMKRMLPVTVSAHLRRSHFLFLGYPPRFWSQRVFLQRLLGSEPVSFRSWAVDHAPEKMDDELWRRRRIDSVLCSPTRFTERLADQVEAHGFRDAAGAALDLAGREPR
jgi:hypothetical protein